MTPRAKSYFVALVFSLAVWLLTIPFILEVPKWLR